METFTAKMSQTKISNIYVLKISYNECMHKTN